MAKTHLFGPVPSRRLGRSLGVDLVPFKTCTFDCVYCQLGPTTDLTADRKFFVSPQIILDELKERLAGEDQPDYITLSGSGEPTLCRGLDDIIHGVKEFSDVPVAVLTNGSLLWDKSVRQELLEADLVIPSLDAGDARLYSHINRPCEGIDFEKLLEGLIAFRKEFEKKIWLEVFLLSGLNSVEADVKKIVECVRSIGPDKVQLNTVARPPAEDFAMVVSEDCMKKLASLFDCPVEIVADNQKIHEAAEVVASREDVLSMLRRRPCTVNDIADGLGIHLNEVIKHIGELVQEDRITMSLSNNKSYYRAKQEVA